MSKVIKYYDENSEKRYDNDLKYWCNSMGELFDFEGKEITEDELPEELKLIYDDYWEENKDSNYTYLAQYKGVNGIALVNEYYDTDGGQPSENDCERAEKVAEKMSEINDCIVIYAKHLGCECPGDGRSTDVVVFMPTTINKDRFDEISKRFSEIAYWCEIA